MILQADCSVPPRSEVVLPTRVVFYDFPNPEKNAMKLWSTKAHTKPLGLRVSRNILHGDDMDNPVRANNPKMEKRILKIGDTVSDMEPLELYETAAAHRDADEGQYDPLIADMVSGAGGNVSDQNRHKLCDILKRFQTILYRDENDLGRTVLANHHIETTEIRPI